VNANEAYFSTNQDPRLDTSRVIRAPRGSELNCKNWVTEAAYRMIQNNLDPEVAENPQHLVVYGGIGRAARNWACFDQILASLKDLNEVLFKVLAGGDKIRKTSLGGVKTAAEIINLLGANIEGTVIESIKGL